MFKAIVISILVGCFNTAASADPQFWKHVWTNTDFSKTSIDYKSVLQGGPGKDGIPAINDPTFTSVKSDKQLSPTEPVMTVEIAGQKPRAYPIRYLMWHEIVNDQVGNVPIAVTFCPLCNSGVVFDRRVNGRTHTFGVSGLLRNSDMIMFDRETESWWQQFTGDAIVGDMLGHSIKKLPSWMESWQSFQIRNPDGLVQREPNSNRDYGRNPYTGYDTGRPFLYNGERPPHGINPMARVIVVGNSAWPMTRIKDAGVLKEHGFTIHWKSGTSSALDSSNIAKGRDVGAIRVQDANGKDVVHDVSFAFAFHAFHPDGEWILE
jgi:hypothetical protein